MVDNLVDLPTRQKETKAKMKAFKKNFPEKWAKQEAKDQKTLDKLFPPDAAGHRRAAR